MHRVSLSYPDSRRLGGDQSGDLPKSGDRGKTKTAKVVTVTNKMKTQTSEATSPLVPECASENNNLAAKANDLNGKILSIGMEGRTAVKGAAQHGEIPDASDDDGETFKVDGKTFKLYKRYAGRDASWTVRFKFGSKVYYYSTETNVARVAKGRARKYIADIRGERWAAADAKKSRSSYASFGQVCDLYAPEQGEGVAKAYTKVKVAKNNVWALGKILRMVYGIAAPTDGGKRLGIARNSLIKANVKLRELSTAKIDGALAKAFQEAMVADYVKNVTDETAKTLATAKAMRTSRSIIHQARSVFKCKGGDLRPIYEKHGLKLAPGIEEFLKAKLQGKDSKENYFPPNSDVLNRTFTRIEEMKAICPHVYIAFWLACSVGLRASEITLARWEHFTMIDGEQWFVGAVGKDGQVIRVPVQMEPFAHLADMRKASGPCLGEGAPNEFDRHVNRFMTEMGWTTEHKIHELRAYIGSRIYEQDPHAAQIFLRHKTLKQTVDHYSHHCDKKVPQVSFFKNGTAPKLAPVKSDTLALALAALESLGAKGKKMAEALRKQQG